MRKALALSLLALSTSGCAAGVSSACPHVIAYTAAEQLQAEAELEVLPDGGIVRNRLMPDYGTLRAGARACAARG